MTGIAKVFKNGRSQAVRLPKEFRFSVDEVRVTRVGNGILLEPIERQKFDPDAWLARMAEFKGIEFPDCDERGQSILDDQPDGSFD